MTPTFTLESPSVNLLPFIKIIEDDSVPNIAGVAVFREEMRKEYEEYIGPFERASVQADIAAAKSDRPVKLTDQQITYLANKYNPRRMSYEEYNAFMYEMIEMGVVTEADSHYITDWERGGIYNAYAPGNPAFGHRFMAEKDMPFFYRGYHIPSRYPDSNGDILTMYAFQSAWRSHDPDTGKEYLGRTERTYNKIYTVLQQMDSKNPECVQARQDTYQKKYQTGRIAWDLRNTRRCL